MTRYGRRWILIGLFLGIAVPGCRKRPIETEASSPATPQTSTLKIAVLDPLAKPLACACVSGYAQRDYEKLGAFLQKRLEHPVEMVFADNLAKLLEQESGPIHLAIGKYSAVMYDSEKKHMTIRPVAMLTGQEGTTTLTGLFVVRKDDPAQHIKDLRERKILLGPEYAEEKNAAALEALGKEWIYLSREERITAETCRDAALDVLENKADVTILSSYCLPLLEGGGTIEKGSLRVIGQTEPVPFITVFMTEYRTGISSDKLVEILGNVKDDPSLLASLESKAGFVGLTDPAGSIVTEWTDWRGPYRDAVSPYVPDALPSEPRYRWTVPLTNLGMSGLAATREYLIVADKDKEGKQDVWRGLLADTGEEVWKLSYPAEGQMDYTNSPRANPVIKGDLAYLLGAFGDIYCVSLRNGREVWKRNILKEFNAKLPTRGMCSTPLIVGDKLIVNPGAVPPEKTDDTKNPPKTYAALAAFNRFTGETVWTSPGNPPGYSSFLLGTFGGRWQIVGGDSRSLGGWDPETGKRLWQLTPSVEGDFNVSTPLNSDGRIIAAIEGKGTCLYDFKDDGTILSEPAAMHENPAHGAVTLVLYKNLLFGVGGQSLYCLDPVTLKEHWVWEDKEAFKNHVSLIAGNDRLLIITAEGELLCLAADSAGPRLISRLRLFPLEDTKVFSHPALMPGRLYVRNSTSIACFVLDDAPAVTPSTGQMTLFDGQSLGFWTETPFLGHKEVVVRDGAIVMNRGNDMTGITWTGPLIRQDYEITLQAMRVEGEDFFCGLTFPVGRYPCTLVCGGWGGMLVGLSNIDYFDAANNETATSFDFKKGQWYDIRLRVTLDRIQAWINDEPLVNIRITGRNMGVRFEVEMARPLGVSTWQTTGAVRNIQVKRIVPQKEPEPWEEPY
ncbi:MAG: PQQ-binding-like beta-propeller repeat protein [Sedimentisphaerales bacterium]|nr:PQQ-binding-like beta-propeller repeat protein [Sedimentisphaerales bacterium]